MFYNVKYLSIYNRDLPCTYGNAQLTMVPIRIFNSDISVLKVTFKEKQQIKILIYNSYSDLTKADKGTVVNQALLSIARRVTCN